MFEKSKQAFAKYALKALNIENSGFVSHHDWGGYSAVTNRMLEIMSNCTERLHESINPRDWVALSDICYINITFFQRAIQKRSAFVGRISAISTLPESAEVQRIVAAANYFIENCPILKEQKDTPKLKTGLNTLVYQIVETCQRRGMCFLEERFDEKGNFLGVVRYNSSSFRYEKTDFYRSELWYNQQKVETENPFFQLLALEYEDGYDWGKPLIYGGAWASESFMKVVNAASSSATRHANPATLTMIANNDAKAFETTKNENGESVHTQTAQMWAGIITSIKGAVLRGLKDMSNGKGSHAVVSVPGKDLTVTSQTYGDGITGGVDKNTLDFFCILLANALDMPVELLSILVSGGGGFGGERFKMIMDSQGDWITATRNDVKPLVLSILKNELRRQGFNPKLIDSIDLSWLYNDFETDLDRANIEKIESETDKNVMSVYEVIAMVNPEAANKYAADNGVIIE